MVSGEIRAKIKLKLLGIRPGAPRTSEVIISRTGFFPDMRFSQEVKVDPPAERDQIMKKENSIREKTVRS